jgi:hypothetical protein
LILNEKPSLNKEGGYFNMKKIFQKIFYLIPSNILFSQNQKPFKKISQFVFLFSFFLVPHTYAAETKLEIKFGYPEGGGFMAQTKMIDGSLERKKDIIEAPKGLRIHWDDLRIADPEKKRQIYKMLNLFINPRMEIKNFKAKTPGIAEGIAEWSGGQVPFSAKYGFFGEDEVRFLFHLDLRKFNLNSIKINDKELDPVVDLILILPYKEKYSKESK